LALGLLFPLVAVGCKSNAGVAPPPDEDPYQVGGEGLAERIHAGSKVAISEPVFAVHHGFKNPSYPSQDQRSHVKEDLETRGGAYPLQLEGALAEALRAAQGEGTSARVITRSHLEPILREHELRWELLSKDQSSRMQLAALTEVDTLVTWNVTTEVGDRDYDGRLQTYVWDYTELWTLQAIKIETGELLGSVSVRRPARFAER
jgi:hypothetical protein